MRDHFEGVLTERLNDVAGAVGDDVRPPADLGWRVAKFRRRGRTRLRVGLGIAAALVSILAVTEVVTRSSEPRTVGIRSTPDAVSKAGRLKPNVALLDARGRYVVALDAAGHQVDTLVVAPPGRTITDVQVTADHQQLWYLSVTAGEACGQVVRADIGTGRSQIVVNANAFAVSPDGSRLAYTGPCGPPTEQSDARTTIRDVATGAEEVHSGERDVQLAFAPDGRSLVARSCEAPTDCGRIGWVAFGSPILNGADTPFAVASDGVYFFAGNRLTIRVAGWKSMQPAKTLLTVGKGWTLQQVLPTRAGVFVVGSYAKQPVALYQVSGKSLVRVRAYRPGELGKLTPVLPLG